MEKSRQHKIETLSSTGNIQELKKLLESGYSKQEIDIGLENAIAYSQIKTADYFLQLGADLSSNAYQGIYYAVHNNELEGLKFAILNGTNINVNQGMLLNTSITTAINTKTLTLVKWLLDNGANPKLLTTQSLKLAQDFGTNELKNLIRKIK